jgi:hypothetical protein
LKLENAPFLRLGACEEGITPLDCINLSTIDSTVQDKVSERIHKENERQI